MGPSGRVYSCTYLMRFMLGQVVVWVELPVQRRLCPIFMSGVGLPDIHDYSVGWRVVNGPHGFGASQLGIRA